MHLSSQQNFLHYMVPFLASCRAELGLFLSLTLVHHAPVPHAGNANSAGPGLQVLVSHRRWQCSYAVDLE